ncbi:MAG: putative pectate lyase [Bacteroidetes bacterium]|nr:putative pectate lyase [Bacteroidota bacterium]
MKNTIVFKITVIAFIIWLSYLQAYAQNSKAGNEYVAISTEPFKSSSDHWYGIYDKNNIINFRKDKPRYKPNEITRIADNILLFQRNNGGWPKNYDMQAILTEQQADSLRKTKSILHTTFDNSTTYTQIDYLAKVYNITHQKRYKAACLKGIQFCLEAQYSNGGWAQYYPIDTKGYSRRITFNDGAYLGIMQLLRKITTNDRDYVFVSNSLRKKVETAYLKGLECILKTQINDHGVLTAWCQQHDEVTLEPAWARAFEPPSICNAESAGVVLFLMQIDHPDTKIIKSIQSAVKWFSDSKILNTRVETIKASAEQTKYMKIQTDRIVVTDSAAAPIWTRYYELGTHRPLFCDRNSKFLYSLSEVSRERRVGYGWYTYSPQSVLNKYPQWQKKWAREENVLKNQPDVSMIK